MIGRYRLPVCAMAGLLLGGFTFLSLNGSKSDRDGSLSVVRAGWRTPPAVASPQGGVVKPGRPADSATTVKSFPADGMTGLLQYGAEKKFMHDRLRGEGRDEAWATRSEAMLQQAYAELPSIGDAGRPVSIACGTTLCEVSAVIDDLPGEVDNKAMISVQSLDLAVAMWGKGYHNMGSTFGADDQGRQAFVTYYRREAPVTGPSGVIG